MPSPRICPMARPPTRRMIALTGKQRETLELAQREVQYGFRSHAQRQGGVGRARQTSLLQAAGDLGQIGEAEVRRDAVDRVSGRSRGREVPPATRGSEALTARPHVLRELEQELSDLGLSERFHQ